MPDQTSDASTKGARAKFERRKAVIVRAAVDVINHKGVRGMTVGEVARKLNVVPTAVSYYFRRKEDLAGACFMQAIQTYEELIFRSAAQSDAEGRVRYFLREFAARLAAVEVKAAEPVAVFNDVRTIHDPSVDAAYTGMFRRIRALFGPECEGGAARLERNAKTHLLISQAYWLTLWLRRYDTADYSRMVERMIDVLVNGLAAPGVSWKPHTLPVSGGASLEGAVSREAFLKAATEMINEHGYLGASVTKISARLNVTKGSFYHHNQAKDDLFGQCFDHTLGIMRQAQLNADALTQTSFDNLTFVAASLIRDDVAGDAPLLRTSALTAVPEEMQLRLIQRFDQISARLASVVSDGIADGSIRPVDANVAAQMITGMINASAELHFWAPGVDSLNAVEIYARPLFVGLFGQRDAHA